MEKTRGCYDFCIPYNKNEKEMRSILNELIELGFHTIAIEQVFDHSEKTDNKRGKDVFPEPINIKKWQEEFKQQLRILQRLTIIYADAAISHTMSNSLNLRKFNLIAGQPKTDAALTHCCTVFNGDIVTFDPEVGAKLLINRKAYQIAVKRGVYFEIKYAPIILDTGTRKDMIKIAQNYHTKGKSKNVIFSSGALSAFQLRSPYDISHMTFIFGLSEEQGKNAVSRFCRQLFLRAESRRMGKTVMFVKGSGPVVFSESESEKDDESDEESDDGMEEIKTNIKEEHSSSEDSGDMEDVPNKKMKLSH